MQTAAERALPWTRWSILGALILLLGPGAVQAADTGVDLYGQHCAVCHQPNGKGIPGVIPPLAGNSRLTSDDPDQIQEFLRRIIFGYHGGLIVNRQVYSGRMPPIGRVGRVNETELRDLVNHLRSSWGNNARPITFEELARARKSESETNRRPR